MPKRSFWFPYLVLWEAIIAFASNITWVTQCPAEVDGHKYSIISCGSLYPVFVTFWVVIGLQVLAAFFANRYIDPEVHSNVLMLRFFFFLSRVYYDFGTAKLEHKYLELALGLPKETDEMSETATLPDAEKDAKV